MSILFHYSSHGVGFTPEEEGKSSNHFASHKTLPAETQKKIASLGLQRVAGNIYECPSTKDFWKVTSGGGIARLTAEEVDNHERLAAAPPSAPSDFLSEILGSLDFDE